MNEEKTKKVYGKVTISEQNTILIDPVFGSKIECTIDESMINDVPQTDENINVIVTDTEQPRIVEFLYSKKEEVSAEPQVIVGGKDKEMTGPILHVWGTVLSIELNDVGGAKVGTVTLQLPHMKLRLMYGRKSEGDVPDESTRVTAEIFDGKLPKIKSIYPQTFEPVNVPYYIPLTDEGEFR